MNALLVRAYALLLHLYPAGFRSAFGEEMQAVFAEMLQAGDRSRLRILLRELAGLPAGLLDAWSWSLRHKALFAPHFSLAVEGLPPGSISSAGLAPAPWRLALLGGLPFVLLGLVSGLPGLLNLSDAGALRLVYLLVLAGTGSLIGSAVHGWPRWSAGWYLIWLLALIAPVSALSETGRGSYQLALMFFLPLLIAWLLYRLARRDRITGVLAGLPAMLVVWIPFMEQTPRTIIPAPLRGGMFLSMFLLLALAAVVGLRTNRLELALALALLASAVGGGLAAYAGIYFGGILSFSEPGPSPRAALEAFLPTFILSAVIVVGPLLGRTLHDLGMRAGRGGRAGGRLALFGLLVMLALAVLKNTISLNDSAVSYLSGQRIPYLLFFSKNYAVYRWGVALAVYTAGAGWLAFAAEEAGVLPRCKLALPLLILPVGVPLALLLGPPVYMGWDYPLRWAVNIFGLVWLGASVWLALKSPALVPPPARLR